MKKIISVILGLTLTVSLFPAVYAQSSISELTIEDVIGHQTADMVTETLTLSNEYTWSANPEGIINLETGELIKDIVEDKEVVLTATKPDATASESFNLTVKAKSTKVIAVDSFEYDYLQTDNAIEKEDFIFYDNSTNKSSAVNPVIEETEDSYFKIDWTHTNNAQQIHLDSDAVSQINAAASFKVAFDFQWIYTYDNSGTETNYTTPQFNIIMGIDGDVVTGANTKQVRLINVNANKIVNGYRNGSVKELNAGWNTVELEIDKQTGLIYMNLNNTGWTTTEASIYHSNNIMEETNVYLGREFTNFNFQRGGSKDAAGTLLIDDFVIYTEDIDNLTDSEKEEYVESILDITDLTAEAAGAITKELNLPSFNGIVSWSSSDENVIGVNSANEKGVIGARDKAIFKTVVLTANYGSKNKKFNFALSPQDTTTIIRANTECELLEDFESGSADENIVITQGSSYNTTKGWIAASQTVEGRSFKYAEDSSKGMVGKLTDASGNTVSLVPGNACGAHFRYTTGFDFKFAPTNTTDTFNFAIEGATKHHEIIVTKNNIRVYEDAILFTDYAVDTENWMRVDIDTNMASRTQEIFVNGVSLTNGPLKNGTYSQQYSTNVTSNTLRYIRLTANGETPVYIDNIAVTGHTNSDRSLADAGVKAAQVFYKGSTLCAKELETNGPVCVTSVLNDKTTFANNGATLKWNSTAVVNESNFVPMAVREYSLNVTATSGSESATGAVIVKGAPVVLNASGGKISAEGNTEGGVLAVAEYDEGGNLEKVTLVKENFVDIDEPAGNYRLFFFDDMSTLVPLAFSK